jgi:hypothetical protein
MKQAYLKDMFRNSFKRVCTSAIIVCPVLLSPTPLASAMKTQKTRKRALITPKQAVEGDIQIEYSY